MTESQSANASGASSAEPTALVETIEAPRLKGIAINDFVLFKEKRDLYERRVREKSSSTGVNMPITTLRNSIEENLWMRSFGPVGYQLMTSVRSQMKTGRPASTLDRRQAHTSSILG